MSAVTDTSILQPHLSRVRIPTLQDRIFKDECMFSFDSPESETGLFVCLNTFIGLGESFVREYSQKTGNCVFLRMKRIRHEVPQENSNEPEKKITRLAIGLEGGFKADDEKKYIYEDLNSIVVLPNFKEIPLPCDDLPLIVQESVKGILSAPSASRLEELRALENTWDGEVRPVSKHAENLVQLNNGVHIPPSRWQCSKCDKTENLWLNLTDGSILCGRKFFDGTGGNNHAVEHYQNTGYPLAVKLGTISGEGKADVYSYAEDDMVEDPHLKQHLAHFGINMEGLQKTDKSMAELEIDLNQRVGEWATIQESGKELVPLHGPGFTGLVNLGNSCYLNSVLQVLFSIPEFADRFVKHAQSIFGMVTGDPTQDFNIQMAKLGSGLLSGRYSSENTSHLGVKPVMFKSLIGKGHPEFSTKRQQDSVEFLLHLINVVERYTRNHPVPGASPAEVFKFRVEERLQCTGSGGVRYTYRPEYHLPVPIPLETAVNAEEVRQYQERKKQAEASGQPLKHDDIVRPRVTLQSCLEALAQPEEVQQFFSTALNQRTTAIKTTRLATFPDYLWIQLRKFTLAEDWTPRKLDVAVEIPEVLDLEWMRGKGKQPGEVPLPEEATQQEAEPQLDATVITSLAEMGFPVEACKRAAYHTKGQGIEAATQWVMEHLDDPDISQPFDIPSQSKSNSAGFEPNEEGVAMLEAMGFTRAQCVLALRNTSNNVERAADWIFSHPDEVNSAEAASEAAPVQQTQQEPQFKDGKPVYELKAFISHMGTSTTVGHYVCHIKKDGRWVIFNDEKVALSENPPVELGYLYLFQRVQQ